MKLISWNVNGIRAVHKKNLFVPLVDQEKPDIICLQETKALQHESPLDLPEYHEYWNSAQKKGYSGTAIFTKEKPINVMYDFPESITKKYQLVDQYGDPNTEGRVIAIEFEQCFVVTVYTPNSKADLSRISLRHNNWDPAFLEYMKYLEQSSTGSGQGKPVVFSGDLNVAHTEDDLANPKANTNTHGFTAEERSGIDAMIKQGFVDTFRLFTQGNGYYSWWSNFANSRARNVGWRIDYWFVSKKLELKVLNSKILSDHKGSDHAPVVLEIEL